jgi:hypothetical protein
VDNVLATGSKQGYAFAAAPGGVDGAPTFTCNADPLQMGASGNRGFFADESGVIRFAQGAVATVADNPVQ